MTVAIRLNSLYAVYRDFDRRLEGPQARCGRFGENKKICTCMKSKVDSFAVKPIA
jgi:hypothetical protein